MASAVSSTRRSGTRPSLTSHQPISTATSSAPPVTASSMSTSWLSVLSVELRGSASTSRSPEASLETRTRNDGPLLVVEPVVKYVVGSW